MPRWLLGLFFLLAIPSVSALSVVATPRAGVYNSAINVVLKADSPDAKIMWTVKPEGTPDDIFEYEKPIPIKYSQELWYFAFIGEHNATKFQKEQYTIRLSPLRFRNNAYIKTLSPCKDELSIFNPNNHLLRLDDWKIEGLNETVTLPQNTQILPKQLLTLKMHLGNVLDQIALQSPDTFPQDFMQYKFRMDCPNITRSPEQKRLIQ